MAVTAGKVSISEAARIWKKDRTTIYRIVNKHSISKEKSEDGKTLVQFVDLRQHLGEPEGDDATDVTTRQQVATPQHDTSTVTAILQQQISDLKEQMKVLHEEYRRREEVAESEKEKLLAIVERQALLIEDKRREHEAIKPPEEASPKSDRLLAWALGGLTIVIGVVAFIAIYYLQSGG